MTDDDVSKIVTASAAVNAPAAAIFELIADPARQPEWDGNDNLSEAPVGQRVWAIGDVFTMTLMSGSLRENHVVEFEEGRRIAWMPSDPGQPPAGHRWRWEIEPVGDSRSLVTHTYDWSELTDEGRLGRARATTSAMLAASIDRLKALAERA